MATSGSKRSKNQLRREKLKQRKLEEKVKNNEDSIKKSIDLQSKINEQSKQEPSIDISIDNPLFEQFQSVFNKFNNNNNDKSQQNEAKDISETNQDTQDVNSQSSSSSEEEEEDSDDDSEEDQSSIKKLSKRQLRIQNKIPLGKLKSFSKNPQIVDIHDIDSKDPYLLISIKSQANIIPIPINWSFKRDYLSSKRGIEKLPFQLPKYIQSTGISEMRSIDNNDENIKLRQKQRDKIQPKLGKLDLDYEKLYNAFYKFQTKPRLFPYGEIFEEGKESNDELISKIMKIKPGIISKNLRMALGMPIDDITIPPAWITIMKDIGKPPSYKDLIIPGLDIGYSNTGYKDQNGDSKRKNFKHWGRLNALDESSSDDDEEEEDEEQEEEEEEQEEELEEKEEQQQQLEEKKEEHQEPTLNDILSGLSADNKEEKTNEDKKLFKILKESTLKSDDSSITGYTYDLKDENKPEVKETKKDTSKDQQQQEEFKF